MPTTDTIVIGAGQAGLAASRCLSDRGVDHVVLERGRVAERWRSERWDSLRLLTPNWMSRLPGWSYAGADPDGYMTAAEVAAYLRALRRRLGRARARGQRRRRPRRRRRRLPRRHRRASTWRAAQRRDRHRLVRPARRPGHGPPPRPRHRPGHSGGLPQPGLAARRRRAGRRRLGHRRAARRRARPRRTSRRPRRRQPHPPAPPLPRAWTSTGGWSASAASTAPSTRCPTRSPPATNRRSSSSADPTTAPSTSATLQAAGVELTGRLTGIDGHHAGFAADLARTVATADARMRRVLADIDAHIDASGLTAEVLDPEPQPALQPSPTSRTGSTSGPAASRR